jgi:hypothetical protein
VPTCGHRQGEAQRSSPLAGLTARAAPRGICTDRETSIDESSPVGPKGRMRRRMAEKSTLCFAPGFSTKKPSFFQLLGLGAEFLQH